MDEHFDSTLHWKVVILYVVGKGSMFQTSFLHHMESRAPGVIIVGSKCISAYVSVPFEKQQYFRSKNLVKTYSKKDLYELNADIGGQPISNTIQRHRLVAAHVYNEIRQKIYQVKGFSEGTSAGHGLCGVALGGDFPVCCVASRGVESLTARKKYGDGIPRPVSNFIIHDPRVPDDFHSSAFNEQRPPIYSARFIRDINTGEVLNWTLALRRFHEAEMLGLRLPMDDGYLLFDVSEDNDFTEISMTTGPEVHDLVGVYVDFFKLDPNSKLNMQDMELCLTELRQQTSDRILIGAVMFSCVTRFQSLDGSVSDVNYWARHFPEVPCTVFNAPHDLIGPTPRAGRQKSIFQKDYATKQKGTCVMLLFMASFADLEKGRFIDDSEECISAFIREKLMNGAPPGLLHLVKRKKRFAFLPLKPKDVRLS